MEHCLVAKWLFNKCEKLVAGTYRLRASFCLVKDLFECKGRKEYGINHRENRTYLSGHSQKHDDGKGKAIPRAHTGQALLGGTQGPAAHRTVMGEWVVNKNCMINLLPKRRYIQPTIFIDLQFFIVFLSPVFKPLSRSLHFGVRRVLGWKVRGASYLTAS